jgi:excisionase family DNA binding protein
MVMKKEIDLSNWESVERELNKRHSRLKRLKMAEDLLSDVNTALKDHSIQYQRLMQENELVMPEEALIYQDGLIHVQDKLETEIRTLQDLTSPMDSDREAAAESSNETHSSNISLSNEERDSSDDMLTLPQVAALLGISESKVRKMSANKELPITKFGTRVRVRRGDLQEWIAKEGRKSRRGKKK